jgi:hypothetical protein
MSEQSPEEPFSEGARDHNAVAFLSPSGPEIPYRGAPRVGIRLSDHISGPDALHGGRHSGNLRARIRTQGRRMHRDDHDRSCENNPQSGLEVVAAGKIGSELVV